MDLVGALDFFLWPKYCWLHVVVKDDYDDSFAGAGIVVGVKRKP